MVYGRHVLSNFITNKELDEYGWKENYVNSTFDVNINTNLESSYFLTQT